MTSLGKKQCHVSREGGQVIGSVLKKGSHDRSKSPLERDLREGWKKRKANDKKGQSEDKRNRQISRKADGIMPTGRKEEHAFNASFSKGYKTGVTSQKLFQESRM